MFQFTMTYLLDELLSPLVTPFILYFGLRAKAGEIIDFFRNFTIEVSGQILNLCYSRVTLTLTCSCLLFAFFGLMLLLVRNKSQ